jgi:hypothetical protein
LKRAGHPRPRQSADYYDEAAECEDAADCGEATDCAEGQVRVTLHPSCQ